MTNAALIETVKQQANHIASLERIVDQLREMNQVQSQRIDLVNERIDVMVKK